MPNTKRKQTKKGMTKPKGKINKHKKPHARVSSNGSVQYPGGYKIGEGVKAHGAPIGLTKKLGSQVWTVGRDKRWHMIATTKAFNVRRGVMVSKKRPPIRAEGKITVGNNILATRMTGENYKQLKTSADATTITAKLYMGTINYVVTTGKVQWAANAMDTGGQYYFNPTAVGYIRSDNIVYRTAQNYDKYRVLGGRFTFIPCISGYSNPDIRVAACVTPAVDHFARMSSSYFIGTPATPTSQDTPNRVAIMSNPHACAVPGWIASFSCPIPRGGWKNCPCGESAAATAFDFTSGQMAGNRQSYAFAMGVSITGTIPAATLAIMEVWMDITLSFRGQAVIVSKDVNYQTMIKERDMVEKFNRTELMEMRRMLSKFRLAEEKDEKKQSDKTFDIKERVESRNSMHSVSIDEQYAPKNVRKSASTKSEPLRRAERDFDSTLGFPGEGPFIKVESIDYESDDFDSTLGYEGEGPYFVNRKKFYDFCEKAIRADLSYRVTRKDIHAELNDLIVAGGDYQIDSSQVRRLLALLTTPPARWDNNSSLALNTLLYSLQDEAEVLLSDVDPKESKEKKKNTVSTSASIGIEPAEET